VNLKSLIAQAKRGELLIPRLHEFLVKENEKKGGAHKSKDAVIQDAHLTVETFKERAAEYNHGGTKLVGEYFHPSQLGVCLRAMWYDHFGKQLGVLVPNPTSGVDLLRTHMTFETGTYVGVVFQNLCERAGYLVKREVPIVNPELKILGHADGLLKIDGKKYILEIKTINARNFTLLTGPKDAHKRQCHAYMKGLGVKQAIVVYLEKDRHGVKEYLVEFDPLYYEEFVGSRIRKFFRRIRTRKAPIREGLSPSSEICRYCDFAKLCFNTERNKQFLRKVKDAG
jgi:hypothetical protein